MRACHYGGITIRRTVSQTPTLALLPACCTLSAAARTAAHTRSVLVASLGLCLHSPCFDRSRAV